MSAPPEGSMIESLLIEVARPNAYEDSPSRAIAWEEIKRRFRVASEALALYADPESWEIVSRSNSDWDEYNWQGDDGKEHAWELAAEALVNIERNTLTPEPEALAKNSYYLKDGSEVYWSNVHVSWVHRWQEGGEDYSKNLTAREAYVLVQLEGEGGA